MNFPNLKFQQYVALVIVAFVVSLAGCGGGNDSPVAGDGETNPGGGANDGGGDSGGGETGGDNGDPDAGVSGEVPKAATASFGDSANDAIRLTGFVSRAQLDLQDGGRTDDNVDDGDGEPSQPIQPDPGDDFDTFSIPFGLGTSIASANPRLKVFTTRPDCLTVLRVYDVVESCTGDIPIESNFDEFTTGFVRYPAGAYLAYSLDGVSVLTVNGETIQFSGDYRFTVKGTEPAQVAPVYRGDFYLDTDNYVGLDENGDKVGPISGRQDATFHDDGSVSIILRGSRYRSYVFIRGSNEQSYRVASGSMIARFGNGYAQVDFSDWNVINGVPQQGSQVRVLGANQETATVEVVSVSPTQVEFAVLVSAGGVNRDYKVTATVTPEGLKL